MGKYVLAALVVAGVLYLPLLKAPFHYEDENWQHNLTTEAHWSIPSRLLTTETYRWTSSPTTAHLANIAIHIANGALVYVVAASIVPSVSAAVTAAIFLLHPLNAEAVSYVANRTDLLMTMFTLLACWAALAWIDRGGIWRWVLMDVALVGAALSKELGLMASLIALMTVAIWRSGHQRVTWLFIAKAQASAIIAVAAWSQALHWAQSESGTGSSVWAWPHFVAVQCAGFWGLLGRVLVPYGQTIDHDWISTPPAFMTAAVVTTLLLVVAGCGAWLARARILTFAIAWLFLTVGPRLVLSSNEFLNEGDFYSAMPALSLLLSAALLYRRQTVRAGATYRRVDGQLTEVLA